MNEDEKLLLTIECILPPLTIQRWTQNVVKHIEDTNQRERIIMKNIKDMDIKIRWLNKKQWNLWSH